MTHDEKKLLSDAIYIINQLNMAFTEAERLATRTFIRVKKNASQDMVRLHLPHYLYEDSEKFIAAHHRLTQSVGLARREPKRLDDGNIAGNCDEDDGVARSGIPQ